MYLFGFCSKRPFVIMKREALGLHSNQLLHVVMETDAEVVLLLEAVGFETKLN